MTLQTNVPDSGSSGFVPSTLSAGSVVFSDGTQLTGASASFFWDNANLWLGIGSSYSTFYSGLQVVKTYADSAKDANQIYVEPTQPTSSTGWLSGVVSEPIGTGSGTNGRIFAFSAFPIWSGTSALLQMNGLTISHLVNGGGSVSINRGIYLKALSTTSGTVTDNYGIFIETQTAGTNDYGIYVQGADTYSIWVSSGVCRFDGNVGLNTVTPRRRMDILDAGGSPQFRLTYTDNSIYSDFQTTSSGHLYVSTTGGNVGINTNGPDRRLDVLDAGNPQLRLTYTDGSVYTDLQTNSSGNLALIPSGGCVGIGTTNPANSLCVGSGAQSALEVVPGGTTVIQAFIRNTSAYGDLRFDVNSMTARYNGTSQGWQLTSLGSFVLGNAAIATNATDGFLYLVTCAGQPTGTPTANTGRVPAIFDTTNKKLWVYTGGAWTRAQVGGVDAVWA